MADKSKSTSPAPFNSGLQVNGEFRIGDKITFGVREGKILLRRAPQGDEVEVAEATLAGRIIDEFFTNKHETKKRT